MLIVRILPSVEWKLHVCATNYCIVRFITSSTSATTTTTTARRPALDPVAITYVFLAEDVGGAFVASGRSCAPRRNRESFLQPMSGGRAPHARPSQSGGRHESPDNPPSNQEASGGEKRPPPSSRGRVWRSGRAFLQTVWSWLERSADRVVVAGAIRDSGDCG